MKRKQIIVIVWAMILGSFLGFIACAFTSFNNEVSVLDSCSLSDTNIDCPYMGDMMVQIVQKNDSTMLQFGLFTVTAFVISPLLVIAFTNDEGVNADEEV